MDSPTARICDDLALYGPGPIPIEDDPLPEERDFDQSAAGFVVALHDMFDGTALEAHTEDLAWSLVNVFHRKIDRLERDLGDNEARQRTLIDEQDGSEIKSVELERETTKGQALLEHIRAFEDMRAAMGDAFQTVTGSSWKPRSGSRKAASGLTSAIVDSRDFSRALVKRELADHLPEGPKIAFGGGPDWLDIDAVYRVLDKVHGRYPDMVLCHGGQARGAEVAAAAWAEARGVAQIVFKPDFAKHGKSAPFKRNDMMIAAGLTGVVLFPGNGITLNLGQKADKARVTVMRCGGGR